MEKDCNGPTVHPQFHVRLPWQLAQTEQRTPHVLLLHLDTATALYSVAALLVSVKEVNWCFDKTMDSADRETQG